jgi:arylsulfatase A-like enzyme
MKRLVVVIFLLCLSLSAQAAISIVGRQSQGWNVPNGTLGTSSFTGVSAQVGDVIVLTTATNKKGSLVPLSATQIGGTGSTGAQTEFTNGMGTYPTSWAWYQIATTAGTFDFDITTDNTAGVTALTGVYVIRADSGLIELAGSATWDDTDDSANPATHTLAYTLSSTLTDGVLIESISARHDDATGPVAYTIDHSAGGTGKKQRSLISYEGITGSSWSSDYVLTLGDIGKQTSGAVGLIFAEVTGGNRAPNFNSDPVVGPSISTNGTYNASLADYASDADGDPMTFWRDLAGPAWLSVAADGALTGTAPGTTGLNSWTVYVADNNGGTNSATLEINVAASEFYSVPLTSSNLYVQGAKYVNIDENGMNFHRFDAGVLSGATAVNVNAVRAKTTSGVMLTFYTRSDTVKLHFDYVVGDEYRNSSKFTTYQNGEYISTPAFSLSDPVEGATQFVIELMSASNPGELVRHDVVLPNWANPILSKMEIKNGEAFEAGNPFKDRQIVFLGDSITHGTGQGTTAAGYPYQVAEALDLELFNMAVGGGKIAPEVADLLQDFEPVEAIWILIGYNDWQGSSKSIATITSEYDTLLATVRMHQPDAEVFCCTLVATTVANDLESGVTVEEVRQGVSDVVNARISAGDTKLYLVNGEEPMTSSDASYTMNTKVHFTELGAADFASNVVAVIDPIINPPKPNILFIAIDDMNPIVGAYGNPLIQTPNMDALAARGMLFENAHCQWAVCGPSRASLMLGLMPEQTGVTGFKKMRGAPDNAAGMTNVVTIPQYFIENGYETAASGKINDYRCVGSINPDGTINDDGGQVDDPPSWSYEFTSPGGVGGTSTYSPGAGKNLKLAAESVDQPGTNFVDGAIASEGIRLLQELAAGDKPFFLGVGFKKPHLPFLAPKSSWDLYQHDDFTPHPFQTEMQNVTPYTFNSVTELRNTYYLETDGSGNALQLTSGILPDDQQKTLLHGYYACISHVDEEVGRVLDELDVLGLTSNTIVVLWGDHGFHLGDHNEWGKHTNLEQATRVPFIISAPGYPQGEKTMAPAGLLDIYPTLCELAGLPIPEQPLSESVSGGRPLAGKSLVPVLTDPSARIQTGVMNHYTKSGAYGYAYRTERYRFTEWVDGSGVVQARELYDYELDPMETVNLAVYPEYEALMYQFSVASRSAEEGAGGCDRLLTSSSMPVPANRSLPALAGKVSGSNMELFWPDAAGVTYNLMSKTNLLDSSWSTNQIALPGSPLTIPLPEDPQGFYRVEVAD